MEIRKNKWHYHLYTMGFENAYCGEGPTNLCSYFWRVVYGTIKVVIIAAVLLGILFGAGVIIFKWPFESSSLIVAVALCITFSYNQVRIKNFFYAKRHREFVNDEVREPGLLRSYIKAKKDKVCPLIEFVE
jgi:hypothetical protein